MKCVEHCESKIAVKCIHVETTQQQQQKTNLCEKRCSHSSKRAIISVFRDNENVAIVNDCRCF
jgi:hypothetical protein